ncbi:GspE/PulE family protein [Sulfurimonas sp.]|jgi:type IV pilus assembly protein PilB|uniref:GspE/PulE family protein n=1 Tax=Sulfurimonas sp. TaxID=2022749 RepID=UPI0025F783A7|nr:type II/IV secretion system protein [Sulfurimonas sp.]MBT5934268.1 Flp pilus assembly complex ATPase component TadA [Sulfurimonas sp.]
MTQNKPIGQLLEELNFITKEQIEVALGVQKANPKFFGETLQDLDFVTSGEIAQAIAMQSNLAYLNLEFIIPSIEALRLVPYSVAKTKNILPVSVDEHTLTVATQEVNDLATLDYLRKISKRNVKFVVEDEKVIARYAEIFYYQLSNPIDAEITKIIQDSLGDIEINTPHLVELLLNNAIKDHATDIHISPESSASHISFRIDGVLQYTYSLPIKLHTQLTARIKILSNLDISEQRKPQDGAFSYEFLNEEFDLRISTLPTNNGENIVMRLLGKNSSLFSLSQLGLTERNIEKVEKYFSKSYGIVLIVGPTGSGKTTTLYSALRKIDSLKKNVLTIEDPIEYKFSFIKQTQLNEKAGYNFQAAIRAFMRQDPDVMLVGEIRDHDTAELAVRASITGHLVLSTLHTNDAVGTIPRLSDLGIEPYLIGSGLLAVIAQRLVRKLCPVCKLTKEITKEELLEQGFSNRILDLYPDYKLFDAVGCDNCRGTGYGGRESIMEILEIDVDIEALITREASTQEILQVAHQKGMYSIKEDGQIKVLQGTTTIQEIKRVVN